MFDEKNAQAAFQWLQENSDLAAEARAQRLHLESFGKTIKARIMSEHTEKPISAQEREAYADERYVTHLKGLKVAIENDEKFRWKRDRAMATLDGWRTKSANSRGV